MGFSLVKLFLLLAIAFILGMSVGWWLWGRRDKHVVAPIMPRRPPPPRSVAEPREAPTRDVAKPVPVTAAPPPAPPPAPVVDSGSDDLKRISGVGPSLERTLNELGVTRFSQIAAWNEADIARVDERLRFRGRIQRDDWQGQARALMSGE